VKVRIAIGSVVAAALGIAPAAGALDDVSTPSGTAGEAQALVESGAAASDGTLPFTGLSLGTMAAVGVALLVTGLVLRRRGSASSE
jgi:hypothetical protein